MKPDVSVHLIPTLRKRLQDSDKQAAIELYYELLSSGHTIGEILNAANSIQCKAGHSDTVTAEHSQSKLNRAPTDAAAEVASADGAQVDAPFNPGLSVSHTADNRRTEEPSAADSAPLGGRALDEQEQLPDSLSGSELDILEPADAEIPASSDVMRRSGDLERIGPARFPGFARRIAFGALGTAAVVCVAVIGFSTVHIVRPTQFTAAGALSDIPAGIETAGITRAPAIEETPPPKKQVVDVEALRAQEPPLRPAEPDPEVPASAQQVAAEIRTTDSIVQPQAEAPSGSEAGRLDATRDSPLAAATSDQSVLPEAPATAPTQAAAAADGIEPAQAHSTESSAGAMPASAMTNGPASASEAHNVASSAATGAELRIEGNRDSAPAPDLAEIAPATQPDAAHSPAREDVAAAPAPRAAEITPEEPRFKTAEADALVTRGDAFFAAGDLASARLFYEYAAAAGNGAAALRLGSTFDPGFLMRTRIGRVQGDEAIASYWYRRARDLGNRDAELLLNRMENTAR
jgi:hypothetical protein